MKKLFMLLLVCSFTIVPAVSAEKTENEAKAEEQAAKTEKQENSAVEQDFQLPERASFLDEIVLYIPSRIMDVMDIFTLDLKAGAMAGAGVHLTRAFGADFEIGPSLVMFKDYNRQYGFGCESGYVAQFLFLYAEDMSVANPIGSVKEYWQYGSNFPTPAENIYNWTEGARDYWAIEATAECLAGVKVAVHPVEIADFLTGLFLFDLKGDDLTIHPMVF